MNNTKIRTRTALFELKEALLTVLLEARKANEGPIQYKVIRKRLGIPEVEEQSGWNHTLIRGILNHLHSEKLVQPEGNRGWEVTEEAATLLDES